MSAVIHLAAFTNDFLVPLKLHAKQNAVHMMIILNTWEMKATTTSDILDETALNFFKNASKESGQVHACCLRVKIPQLILSSSYPCNIKVMVVFS